MRQRRGCARGGVSPDRVCERAKAYCLVALSSLLRRHLRRSDPIGRYGGEEFAILLDNVHEDDAVRLMTRLGREFAQIDHQAPNGAVFQTTFSGGVARLDVPDMDLDRWFNAADGALYDAKKAGRHRVLKAPA